MNRTAIAAFVAAEIRAISGHPLPIDADTMLGDLPLDSLQCIELTAAVEDEYDMTITCAERVAAVTVGDMVDLVAGAKDEMLMAA